MEAMDSDPGETAFNLREELFELLHDLKDLKYSCVDDFARFLEITRDDEARALIPKLRKQEDHMQFLTNIWNLASKQEFNIEV
jgi:hypothetical protein